MAKLTVRRKEYTRKAFTAKRGGKTIKIAEARVRPSTFKVRDMGDPGRGPKVVPPLEKGALGGPGFFNRAAEKQKQIVFSRAKKMGERKVVGELRGHLFVRAVPATTARSFARPWPIAFDGHPESRTGSPLGEGLP